MRLVTSFTAKTTANTYLAGTKSGEPQPALWNSGVNPMQTMLRPLLIGSAFAAMVVAGVAALTLSGETKEAGFVEDACAKAAWPLVPANCLDGGRVADVRVVGGVSTSDQAPAISAMAERFNNDFE
jgi:hypothetical protein